MLTPYGSLLYKMEGSSVNIAVAGLSLVYIMKYIAVSCIFLFFSHITYGQTTTYPVQEIISYVKYIDSIRGNAGETFISSIAEGTSNLVTVSVTKVKRKKTREIKKRSGGFSVYTLANRRRDTVCSINANDNLQKYLVKTFYYQSNVLVCAKIRLEDWNGNGILTPYRREQYYHNGALLMDTIINNGLNKEDEWRIKVSLCDQGQDYLKEFFNKDR